MHGLFGVQDREQTEIDCLWIDTAFCFFATGALEISVFRIVNMDAYKHEFLELRSVTGVLV